MKCSVNDCDTPTVFKKVFAESTSTGITNSVQDLAAGNINSIKSHSIGSLIIDHRSLTPNKVSHIVYSVILSHRGQRL